MFDSSKIYHYFEIISFDVDLSQILIILNVYRAVR